MNRSKRIILVTCGVLVLLDSCALNLLLSGERPAVTYAAVTYSRPGCSTSESVCENSASPPPGDAAWLQISSQLSQDNWDNLRSFRSPYANGETGALGWSVPKLESYWPASKSKLEQPVPWALHKIRFYLMSPIHLRFFFNFNYLFTSEHILYLTRTSSSHIFSPLFRWEEEPQKERNGEGFGMQT